MDQQLIHDVPMASMVIVMMMMMMGSDRIGCGLWGERVRVLGIYIPALKRGLLLEHIRPCMSRHIYNAAAFMHTYEA
mgnify:CR=1 FL=1